MLRKAGGVGGGGHAGEEVVIVTEVGRAAAQRCEPDSKGRCPGHRSVAGTTHQASRGWSPSSPLSPGRAMRQAEMVLGAMEGGGTRLPEVHQTAPQTWPPGRAGFGARLSISWGSPGLSLGSPENLDLPPYPPGWQGRPSGGGSGPCLLSPCLRAHAQPREQLACSTYCALWASLTAPPTTPWAGRAITPIVQMRPPSQTASRARDCAQEP